MDATRNVGINLVANASSVYSEVPRASREFDKLGDSVVSAGNRSSAGIGKVDVGIKTLIGSAAGLSILQGVITSIGDAITALPRAGFDFSREIEVSQMGMAGILGSMTAINGKQTEFTAALAISGDMIRKLNDDALRTAATSQELITVFQALMAPGLAARMNLDQIRQLTVVGTNAVKSMGLNAGQVVQELRDLVAGGITPASSTMATALGLKDEDISRAKASSEGLFAFLMSRLQGFAASADAFGDTMKGKLDQLQEGATRVAAAGMEPLFSAIKESVGQAGALFQTIDSAGKVQLNPALVSQVRGYAEGAVTAIAVSRDLISGLWQHRDAVVALASAYAAVRFSVFVSEAVAAVRAKTDLVQASRLAAAQAAAEAAVNGQVAAASSLKTSAYLAELQAQAALTQANAAATESQVLSLQAELNMIAVTRSSTQARFQAAQSSIVASQAQLAAARSAGALSYALAVVRESTVAVTAAEAQRAAASMELSVLTQRRVQAETALASATTAHTAALSAAAAASSGYAAATGAASLATRGLGLVSAALGGPVGIGVLAVTALAMGMWSLKSKSDAASESVDAVRRAEEALARGRAVRDKDVSTLMKDLDAAKDTRDALELRAKGVANNAQAQDRFKTSLDNANAEVARRQSLLDAAQKSTDKTSASTDGLGLSLSATEQAWKKSTEGAKTASAAQQEYDQKLTASRQAFDVYKAALVKSGAGEGAVKAATAKQAEAEKAFAVERDKKLKEMNASGVSATDHALAAQVEAVKRGYRLQSLATTDALDEIDSLRQRDLVGEYSAVERRRDLNLQDLSNKEKSLQRELQLIKGKSESAKEQERIEGELRELQQSRTNVQNKAARDQQELLVKPQLEQLHAVQQATESTWEQANAQEQQNRVMGLGRAALADLLVAELERQKADLEGTDRVIPGYVEGLEKRIAAEKRLAGVMRQGEVAEASTAARSQRTQKAVDDAQQAADSVSNVFRDGFARAFRGDDDFASNFTKSLKTAVATGLAEAFYSATVKDAVEGFTKFLRYQMSASQAASSGGSGLLGSLLSIGSAISMTTGDALGMSIGNTYGKATQAGLDNKIADLLKSAKGNVFSAPGLHSYVNTVVDRPTMFPFAKGGLGIMGEAPSSPGEAIVPLKRMAGGDLGVSMHGFAGGRGSFTFAPTTVVHMDSRSDRAAAIQDMQQVSAAQSKADRTALQRMKVVPA